MLYKYLRYIILAASLLLALSCNLLEEITSPVSEDPNKENGNGSGKEPEKEADTLEIVADQTTFGAEGGTLSVEVKSNIDVTVKLDAYTAAWVKTQPFNKTVTSATLQFVIAPNTGYEGRTGTILFTNPEAGITRAVDIVQLQKDARVVSDGKVNAPVDGGIFEVTLGHNVDYVCDIDTDWIQDVTAKAFIEEPFSFQVLANPTPKVRTGHIRFSAKDANGQDLVQEVLVTQEALVVYITLSPTSVKVFSEGASFTVLADSNVEPAVAVSDAWIVSLGTDPEHPGLYGFQVEENPEQDERVGTITFEHAYYEAPATVSVRQPGLRGKLGYGRTGIYGYAGEDWLFTVGADQVYLSWADTRTFTLLTPADNRFFQVSGITANPEEGDVLNVRVVQNKWNTVEAAINTQLSVTRTDGPFAELSSDQGFSIVVKTR